MMQAVENRMAQGDYYEDDPREYILDTAKPADYAEFVYDNNLEVFVFGKWLGVILTPGSAADLWEHLDPDFVDTLCQPWVEKNKLDDFVEYKKEKYYGAV